MTREKNDNNVFIVEFQTCRLKSMLAIAQRTVK